MKVSEMLREEGDTMKEALGRMMDKKTKGLIDRTYYFGFGWGCVSGGLVWAIGIPWASFLGVLFIVYAISKRGEQTR